MREHLKTRKIKVELLDGDGRGPKLLAGSVGAGQPGESRETQGDAIELNYFFRGLLDVVLLPRALVLPERREPGCFARSGWA
jgi:hypothetical protein